MIWEGVIKDIDKYTGFVYIITNISNQRYYIGQKKFWKIEKKKPLKGKKRRRWVKKESDWQTYYGSCEELTNDVKLFGDWNFSREIVRLCKTKSEMNYYEAKLQFEMDVLFDDRSYNRLINCKINARTLR